MDDDSGWRNGLLDIPDLDLAPDAGVSFFAPPRARERQPSLQSAAGKRRIDDFECPMEALEKRRRLGDDVPEHWERTVATSATEVLVYSSTELCFAPQGESHRVLSTAFKSCFSDEPPGLLQTLVDGIAEASQFKVLSVTRLQNFHRYAMHKHFGKLYQTGDDARTVYHGTSAQNARVIAKVGFRTAGSRRAKFGMGIYSTPNVWEALAYAEPDESYVQTFLVVDLLTGPMCVGHENMADFGQDDKGRQILTVTNPGQNILCASYEDQMYAHYRVTVRCVVERALSPNAFSIVKLYHPTIWDRIKTQGQDAAADVGASLPVAHTPKAPKAPVELKTYQTFRINDKVKVLKNLQCFPFCVGQTGFIRKIVKDGHVHFCIELDDPSIREKVKQVNDTRVPYKWFTEPTWLRCILSHIVAV